MAIELHPSPDQLRDFAQGRLSAEEAAGVEEHVAHCDSCCLQLEWVPEDTLVQIARAAATAGVKSPEPRKTPPREAAPAIPPELVDHPRYRVLGVVGTGGMGAVYKAEHRLMERLVALKVISRSMVANPAAVERFQREFRAAARLSHGNIVAAYDADQAGDLHFLVMEFVEGISLDRLVAQQGRLPPPQAAGLIRQAALGLQHAHEKGMVHRDIKPHNLMVTKASQLKILDFGLARLASERQVERAGEGGADDARPGATTAGMILGTPDYIAPEQVSDARNADIRADIYSLGCTLYYLLTGAPPYPKGTVMDKLASHMKAAPAALSTHRDDVPPELVRILDKMLAKDPAQRYQTPGEVAKELAPVAKGQGSAVGNALRGVPNSGAVGNALRGVPNPAPDEIVNLSPVAGPAGPGIPVNEFSVLSTPLADPLLPAANPLDPLTTDADLGVSLGNLPPLIQAPSAAAFPLNNPKAIAALAACGVALLLIILAFPIAIWLLGKSPGATSGANSPGGTQAAVPANALGSNFAPIPPAPGASGQAAVDPFAPGPASPRESSAAATTGKLPRKVLLVIPSRGLWVNDYRWLADAFARLNVSLEVASTTHGPITDLDGNEKRVPVDVLVQDAIVADYGAIIFAGCRTEEYMDGGIARDHAERLIDGALANDGFVAGICVGQRVLAHHGALNNKQRAHSHFFQRDFSGEQRGAPQEQPVVRDGQIFTAGNDHDADALAQAIVSALNK